MAMKTTAASDHGSLVPTNRGGSPNSEDDSKPYQPFQRKPKRLKKDGTPYKPRRGWGPYRSVPNERAAAFNLKLDIQALQQEIQNLTALRDILRTKPMIQRHFPEGSLMQVVREYFRVFRTGPVLNTEGGNPYMTAEQQYDFLYNIVDAEVDVGNGLRGPDIMVYQLDMYSMLLRWIRLEMHSFDIVEAEDSVIIKAGTAFQFQVLRETIRKVFPHIIGDEWLVSQLVGKTVESSMDITFYFNAEGKCCKMVVDTDFVGAFASILQHPESVDLLFGRAVIADNSMLGVIEELPPHAVETYDRGLSGVGAAPHYGEAGTKSSVNRKLTSVPCYDQAENMASPRANACSSLEPLPPRPSTNPDILKLCLQTVEDYYLAFSRGYQTEKSAGANELILAFQHDFLLHRFASATAHGNYTSAEYVAERWRSLSTWFSVLGFNKKSVASIEHHEHVGTCALSSSARYTLCITPTTVQSVFPHIEAHSPLYGELVGEIVTVPSQIYFSVDIETGQICRLEERMDFVVGLSAIVASKQELDFVMSKANLTLDGVNF